MNWSILWSRKHDLKQQNFISFILKIMDVPKTFNFFEIYDAEKWSDEGNHEHLNFEFAIRLRKKVICMEMT